MHFFRPPAFSPEPNELRRELDDASVILVDVRTPDEYCSGHIPGALSIPLSEIEHIDPSENTDAALVVYCRTGSRSKLAREILEARGYRNVRNFGGYTRWNGELVVGAKP